MEFLNEARISPRDVVDLNREDRYSRHSFQNYKYGDEQDDEQDDDTTEEVRQGRSEKRYREDGTKVGSWLDATSPHMAYAHRSSVERSSSSHTPGDRERDSRSATPTSTTHYDRYRDDRPSELGMRRSRSRSQSHDGPPREQEQQQTQLAQRGRWQTLLSEAGGLSVAFSEESMKKLKYCLNWLQWAIQHIDAQILFLRELTVSLQQQHLEPVQEENNDSADHTASTNSSAGPRSRRHVRTGSASISEAHHRKLNDVRKDVVHTIRQVVVVVSKYAGDAALPEQARNTVKGFILMLPKKWAEAVRVGGGPAAVGGAGGSMSSFAAANGAPVLNSERESVAAAASGRAGSDRRHHHGARLRGVSSPTATTNSPVSSRNASPAVSPRVIPRPLGYSEERSRTGHDQTMSASAAMVTAQRILALATESLDMMRGVTGVVKDSLDKADAWVERLRRVGYHHRGSDDTAGNGPLEDHLPLEERRDALSRSSSTADLSGRDRDYRRYGVDSSSEGMLSPLYLSRRGSMSDSPFPVPPESPYSTYSTLGTGSIPGTPSLPALSSLALPVDAPSPGVGGGMRRMNLADVDADITPTREVKRESRDSRGTSPVGLMDVDS
ncbi:transcriptional regulator opi1 [Paramarasmius palmivorus]|uniref:Transcriptional regulator opi1 n=1 Tax=Paramarasmius palmivorus TaxID=297713 RepID=A0AAW0CRP3_9AGAR